MKSKKRHLNPNNKSSTFRNKYSECLYWSPFIRQCVNMMVTSRALLKFTSEHLHRWTGISEMQKEWELTESRRKKRKSSDEHFERGSSKLAIMQPDVSCVCAQLWPEDKRTRACVLKIIRLNLCTWLTANLVFSASGTTWLVLFKFALNR